MAGAGLHGHRVQACVGRQQRCVGAGGGPPDLRLRVRGRGAHKVTGRWEDDFISILILTILSFRVKEVAYENQRWIPVEGFGSSLLPTDRPRFH